MAKKTVKKAAKKSISKPVLLNGTDITQLDEKALISHIDKLQSALDKLRNKSVNERENKAKPFRDRLKALNKSVDKLKISFSLQLPIDFQLEVRSYGYDYEYAYEYDYDCFEIVSAKAKLGGNLEGKARKYLQDELDNVMSDVCSDILCVVPEKSMPSAIAQYSEMLKTIIKDAKAVCLSFNDIEQ